MQVLVSKIEGSWDVGFALHKHVLSSMFVGYNESGYPQFDTTRSEPGEALFQLKYRNDWSQVGPLAEELQRTLMPRFENVGLIIPMPASTARARQPVEEIAIELGRLTNIPVFSNIIVKAPAPDGAPQLKNLHGREEKDAALAGRFSINPAIATEGRWNALVIDDLFDTGATMDAVCRTLRTYRKIDRVYAASITRK
jgi:predicted amidophosphoribosyltransferase